MTQIKCPSCGHPHEWSTKNPWRPFCSERCRSIDLGEWFNENRSMSANEGPEYGGETPPGTMLSEIN